MKLPLPDVVGSLAATLALSAALLTPSTSSGGDWPEFRGPTGQGHSSARHLPVAWEPESSAIQWKTAIPGAGWSSPVLGDSAVFVTTAAPIDGSKDLSLQLVRVGQANGKIAWSIEIFRQSAETAPGIHAKNGHASPTPILDGNRLYVHFGHQGTACVDLKGRILWKTRELPYPPVHGNGGSPALVDDLLVFGCDGGKDPFLAALDKNTGKLRWKTPREITVKKPFSFSTPLVIEVKGRKQIISPASGAVCAYRPEDGKELWRARYGEGYSVVPRPVFAHGLVFVGSGYDRPIIHAVRVDGAGDVTDTHIVWTLTKGAPNTPSMLVVGDELYCVSDAGIASCLDAKTGRVHWSERLGGNFSASPLYAENRIYFQNEEGKGFVVAPGTTFQLLHTNSIGERSLASYAADDGALYVRGERHLNKIVTQR